ncbi:MAG: TonB-dependent receptor, partial [Candidatus Baltobacteraceae bacterium]
GQQELQVYTGAGPAGAQSNGLSGFVNQVIKTGTYPGYGQAELGMGTPTFYHKAQIEAGGATPNRNFSYYVATAGFNQQYRLGTQANGAELESNYGSLYNVVAANCGTSNATAGCYANGNGFAGLAPLGPGGYALGPLTWGYNASNQSRESVVNFHFGIPHHKDGGKDDIQLLYDNSLLQTPYQTGMLDWGDRQTNVANGTALYNGVTYGTCGAPSSTPAGCAIAGPVAPPFFDTNVYSGPMGVALNSTNINQVQNYYAPNSPLQRSPFTTIPPQQRDSYNNRASIVKVQYQKNIGSNAYARIYGYSFYSDWMQNGLGGLLQNFVGAVSPDYELITHTRGVVGTFADQLNSKHLLNLTAGYTYASTVRWNNAWYAATSRVGVLVNSSSPTSGLCYTLDGVSTGTALNPIYCGSSHVGAYSLQGAGSNSLASNGHGPCITGDTACLSSSSSPGDISSFSCGGGPCEYLSAETGVRGSYNTVAPRFTNVSLDDTFRPTDKLNINLGVHFDDFRYDLPSTATPIGPLPQTASTVPRILWQNSFNLFHCVSAGSVVAVPTPNNVAGSCPTGYTPIKTSVQSPSLNDYHAFEPRIGATYTVNPLNVVRASWGKYEQPASSAFQQYNNATYNLPNTSPNTAFYPLGFFDPTHQVYPEESYNLDFSWEHQVKGSDLSFKLSPFLRKTKNELYQVLLDPKTNFVSAVNVGNLTASGVEFQLNKGDFSRNGFAGQLSYTYTYATVKFSNLPTGGTVLDGVNQSIQNYNGFTSYCASHSTDKRCGSNSGNASPCYAAGAPDPTCTPVVVPPSSSTSGTSTTFQPVANPYWNAPIQSLYDPGASYIAYNQLPGTGLSSVASSYNVPHVASLLLNYRHDRFAITPALQIAAGGRYGSPVEGNGVDPSTCSATLGGAVTGDTRYPYGGAGGQAYDAQSCAGLITTPNFQTGHFDNFGEFIEPTSLNGSLQASYDVSNKVTLRLTAANVITSCFGGTKEPWTSVPNQSTVGCWYTSPGGYIGNVYNPGNQLQQPIKNSYVPTLGNTFQQAYGGQNNPLQLFLSAEIKL